MDKKNIEEVYVTGVQASVLQAPNSKSTMFLPATSIEVCTLFAYH